MMIRRRRSQPDSRPLPHEFLAWQVRLRAWTMEQRAGVPHAGVAPLLVVAAADGGPAVSAHSIICGLLPRPELLAAKTEDFRGLYERWAPEGARVLYDRGIDYLRGYYRSPDDFDPGCITTLLARDLPVVDALRVDPRCALVFYVYDLDDRSEVGRYRCLQLNGWADLHASGPEYENVWWHNALFHGKVDDHVMVRFRHQRSFDTRFGILDPVHS
jgi:hypothetical protein